MPFPHLSAEGDHKGIPEIGLQVRRVGLDQVQTSDGCSPQSLGLFFLCSGSIEGMAGGRDVRNLSQHYAFCLDAHETLALAGSADASLLMLQIQHQLIPSNYRLDRLHWQISSCDHLLYCLCQERSKIELLPRHRSLFASVQLKIDQLILELILTLFGKSGDPPFSPLVYLAEDDSTFDECIAYATAYIDDRLDRSIKIVDLCRHIGLSPRSFQKKCKSRLGRSPRQLVQERRMIRLKALLEARFDIASACAAVGLKASGTTAGIYRGMFGELPSHTVRKAKFLDQS